MSARKKEEEKLNESKEKEISEEVTTKEVKAVVYCGPDLPYVKRFHIFTNGTIDKTPLGDHIKGCKVISKLLIPIKDFSKKRVLIDKQGTAENALYKKVLKYREETYK